MALDSETKKRLLQDLDECNLRIREVLGDPLKNFFVMDNDYLTPSILFGETTDLESPNGKLAYYQGIRKSLEETLVTGNCPRNSWGLSGGTPYYLRDLIE